MCRNQNFKEATYEFRLFDFWIFFPLFRSYFLAFLGIFQAPMSWSLWTRHHWKDIFLLQKLSIDDANFGQKLWCQKWKKGQGSSRAVTGGTGVNGLINQSPAVSLLTPSSNLNLLSKLIHFSNKFLIPPIKNLSLQTGNPSGIWLCSLQNILLIFCGSTTAQ